MFNSHKAVAVLFACSLLGIPSVCFGIPKPIIRNNDGGWSIDHTGDFSASGMTMDVRRFAQIPDSNADRRPRLNSLAYAPGDDRLFVVDRGAFGGPGRTGAIYGVNADGSNVELLLHVGEAIDLQQFGQGFTGQGGLRSLSFHPQFNKVGTRGYGKLYTTQIVKRPTDITALTYIGPETPELAGEENGKANDLRDDGMLAEWTATFDAQGRMNGIDAASVREIFRITTPSREHPMKQIAFNPHSQPDDDDYGLLYLMHGDGVSGPNGTGQDGLNALGKVLRINPLQSGEANYTIPSNNPFTSSPDILDEVYTLGHRNPHTISFVQDDQGASHLLIGEIGNAAVEEINLIGPGGGGDFGWSEREGTLASGRAQVPANDAIYGFTYPVAQFAHSGSGPHAIAGGYSVRNGSELDGHYFFTDFTSGDRPMFTVSIDDLFDATLKGEPADIAPATPLTVSWTFDHDDDPSTPSIAKTSFHDILNDEASHSGSSRTDLRFGQGPSGELYLMNKQNGWIYQVTNSLPSINPADFDFDGDVDNEDLAVWKTGYGLDDEASQAQGDADGDGDVDGGDFLIWQMQISSSDPVKASQSDVPEPSTLSLLACMTFQFFARKRSKTSHNF